MAEEEKELLEEFIDNEEVQLEIEMDSNIKSEEEVKEKDFDIDINSIKSSIEQIEGIEKIEIMPIMDIDQIFAHTENGIISLGVLAIKCDLIFPKDDLEECTDVMEKVIGEYYEELPEDIEYDGRIELTGVHRMDGSNIINKLTRKQDFIEEYVSVKFKLDSDSWVFNINRGADGKVILDGEGHVSLTKDDEDGEGATDILKDLVSEYETALEELSHV